MQPINIANLTLELTMSVDLESFWTSSSNKYELQTISKQYFINKSLGCAKDILTDGSVILKKELNSLIEEADSRMISHIAKAGEEKNKRVVVMSNDIDLVLYNSGLKRWGIKQIWFCFGTQEKRDIPIYLM